MLKNCGSRTTFGSFDVEKLHTAAARSAFASPNVKNLTGSDHFLNLGCRKIARSCGAKRISKSKCTKYIEVLMWKNCTPLWREARLQVKMLKNWRSRNTFWSQDVGKLHAAVARSTFASQNVKNSCVLEHFWGFRCRKGVRQIDR